MAPIRSLQSRSGPHFIAASVALAALAGWAFVGLAQVSPPITASTGAGNLGTTVLQAGNVHEITGGTRPGNGPNLFHSFGHFNVPDNHVANFLNETALPTSNILGRVTGGNPSNIFGTVQTTQFGNANLFLMNPAGIVFGPNASLNVGGSATFTTADYLHLADGVRFTALPGPQDTSITSSPVAAFGFLGSNPAAISVQGGQLAVAEGQTLSLVGGDLSIQGVTVDEGLSQPVQLAAPGGHVRLASAASAGEVNADTLAHQPNSNAQSFEALGTVHISEQAAIDTSGLGGGTVTIRGGRFLIDDSRISANSAGGTVGQTGRGIDIEVVQDAVIRNQAVLESNVTAEAAAGVGSGGVRIKADHIEIAGVPEAEFPFPLTGIRSNVEAGSSGGKSGDVILEGNSLLIRDEGQILAQTSSGADSGHIRIRLDQHFNSSNGGGLISTGSEGDGRAGDVTLTSHHGDISLDRLFIQSQATPPESGFTELSTGTAGSIHVSAPRGTIELDNGSAIFNQVFSTGTLGEIRVEANNLTLKGFSAIEGDNLTANAPQNITISLTGRLSVESNSSIQTIAFRSAPAADLTITSPEIHVTGGGSRLSTETFRQGAGGRLTLLTDDLRVTDGGQIRSGSTRPFTPPGEPISLPTGAGGTITVRGANGPARAIVVDGTGSSITTDAQGAAPGGSIHLEAQSVIVENGGSVSASTSGLDPAATGGNISILASQSTTVRNNGTVTASSTGPANAGNIGINAGSQFLSQGGRITTQASQASGGNIIIQAVDAIRFINSELSTSVQGGPTTAGGNILLDPAIVTLQNSQILAEAVQGQGGNINIIAGTFLVDQASVVSASSQFGVSGTVNIQSPISNLSGSLATLPKRPLLAQALLQQRCAAQAQGRLSSFVVAGRDTLPAEPGSWLLSPALLVAETGGGQASEAWFADADEEPATSAVSAGKSSQLVNRSSHTTDHLWAGGCGS